MRIILSPFRSEREMSYRVNGENLCVTIDGALDEFDFSDLGDGKSEYITSSLPVNPVLSAERIDGELTVTMLYFHMGRPSPTEDETDADYEKRISEWIESTTVREVINDG